MPEPIAIVGTGCRFPGAASSPTRLWSLLSNPQDVASKIPKGRFNVDAYYHPDGPHGGTSNVQESYFLQDDVRAFDAPFFNISAAEAESMDPQQRLVLETVYESLEAGGLRLSDLRGSSTGVYCGQMCDDYSQVLARDTENLPRYTSTGMARNNASNRVSYFFDWHGPSMTIDTACSSSLVAVHLAVNALRAGDCNVAIAAGTNLILSPIFYISASNLTMLSPTGRSRMWDEKADGYARGEGVASLALKRLSDAIRDGDPIECVIRESNVNQDGRSMGITMPSSEAQAALIRSTYAKAGLQLERPRDRCQYFEAHGTGTQAGDPQEAGAIASCFSADRSDSGYSSSNSSQTSEDQKLYVGSIKTVLGHTEGTAGLAGVIKASLCMQNDTLVPNLHFNNLNPKVEPFYSNLEIPTKALPWPETPEGVPKRASVNSFGFGGTNAHVILEGYEPQEQPAIETLPAVLPFAFSAISEKTLGATLNGYAEYLESHPEIDLVDMAWSLLARREQFTHRVTLWASSVDALKSEIEAELQRRQAKSPSTKVVRSSASTPKSILGVFTGQGAQWPQMGLDLINVCPAAKDWLADLQKDLDTLPEECRPQTTLFDELSAAKESSRLDQAAVSQPLCTAVQILLVNYLRELGISLSVVVGHSSGEIAAAYAAGVFSATSAIRIAHLRGHVAQLAGANDQPGSMLAAGLAPEEAKELCEQEQFQGRIKVAAFNSPSSITLSGDADAVKEVDAVLKEQGKFARVLRVSTAYHSHHMVACSEPYIKALAEASIQTSTPTTAVWFSSVHNGQEIGPEHLPALAGDYWNNNMLNSVMFTQACTAAMNHTSYDMIVEIGPHPALKGPFMQTMGEIPNSNTEIPYIGLLKRGGTGVESFATAIGSFWTNLGADAIDTSQYVKLFDPSRDLTFVRNLPTYQFDHSQTYWAESRLSKNIAHREHAPNQLLGIRSPERLDGEWRWRNYLRRADIDWLEGHQIQSQVIFPATGYVAMALEAASAIAGEQKLQLVEVGDFAIETAISLSDDAAAVETIFKVENLWTEGSVTSADFSCHAAFAGTIKLCARGTIKMAIGGEAVDALPPRSESQPQLPSPVDIEEFYEYLGDLGYGYTGLFHGINALTRQMNASSGTMLNASSMDSQNRYILHPALMDTILQTILAAIGTPGDGRLATLQIPTKINRITINTGCLNGQSPEVLGSELPFDAVITGYGPDGVQGDADLFTAERTTLVHMEGVQISPLETLTPEQDRLMFSETVWGPMHPDAEAVYVPPTREQLDTGRLKEKLVLLSIRDILAGLSADAREKLDWHQSRVVAWFDNVVSATRAGEHPICAKDWLNEDRDTVAAQLAAETGVDMLAIQTVAETVPSFLHGESSIMEALREKSLLDRLKRELADPAIILHMADVAGQIAFRYPRMKIMEVGASGGPATQAILDRVEMSYHSYMYTDVSPVVLEEAEKTFSEHAERFTYKLFEPERGAKEQGFQEGSYDLVVAAGSIHPTACLKDTLTRMRSLLKPGGYLLCLEGTNTDDLLASFIFSGFEKWWQGEADGRPWGLMAKATEWDGLLKDAGFAGMDTITPHDESLLRPFSVFVAQAVDDRIQLLREPLASGLQALQHNDLVIIGGAKPETSSLVAEVEGLVAPSFSRVIKAQTLESLDLPDSSMATILNIADLETPCFDELNEQRFNALKTLMGASYRFLWITAGPESENPYQSMSKGLLACAGYENPLAYFQHYNIVDEGAVQANTVAAALMRMAHNESDNDYSLSNGVWNIETEIRLENGKPWISRLRNDSAMNNRYMSERRVIHDSVDVQNAAVRVQKDQDAYEFLLEQQSPKDSAFKVQIRVDYSTSTAVRVDGIGFLHLIVGHDEKTQARLLALSETNASIVSVPPSWCYPLPSGVEGQEASYLTGAAAAITAEHLLAQATPNTSILVHEADEVLRNVVSTHAKSKGVKPCFTTSKPKGRSNETVYLHEMMPTSTLMRTLPRNVSVAASVGASVDRNFARIEQMSLTSLRCERPETLRQDTAVVSKPCDVAKGAALLQIASQLAESCMATKTNSIDVERLTEDGASVEDDGVQILNWTQASAVPVKMQPASSLVVLSAHKTYLLVGMTGDLGQSVCRWMLDRGARNFVLTSRNPKVDQRWIEEMAELGANVVPMSM